MTLTADIGKVFRRIPDGYIMGAWGVWMGEDLVHIEGQFEPF